VREISNLWLCAPFPPMPVRRRKKPPDPSFFSLHSFICNPHDHTSDLQPPLHVYFPQPLDLGLTCGLHSESGRTIARSAVEVTADIGEYLFVRIWMTTNSNLKSRSGYPSCSSVWLASQNPIFCIPSPASGKVCDL